MKRKFEMSEEQIDKIKGVFFGQAIGDALGLGTEFLNKSQIAANYPNGISTYDQIIQDKHRVRWAKGDWTDDTDQFLCICKSILETRKVDELAFAEELYKWFKGTPMGIGLTVYKVVSLPQFTLFPHKGAKLVWKLLKKQNASNGAIMRTSILGTYQFWDYLQVEVNTQKIAKVTHWDDRCVGSCVIVTKIIAHLINENRLLTADEIIDIGEQYSPEIKIFVEKALSHDIEYLQLDEPVSIGYTLKALSAGLWAYFNASNFGEGLLKVVNEGGDADTNASVACSLLGAKFGYSAIPPHLILGLNNYAYLESMFELYIEMLSNVVSNQ